jgi:hypothetical protein
VCPRSQGVCRDPSLTPALATRPDAATPRILLPIAS